MAQAVSPLRQQRPSPYPLWFFLPAAIIYCGAVPGADLRLPLFQPDALDAVQLGVHRLREFRAVLREPFLIQGLVNTVTYAVVTSGLKVVIGMAFALLLTSNIIARGYLRSVVFFPVLVSTVGVGITFHGADAPHPGHDQRGPGAPRHQVTRLADRSAPGAVLGGTGRRMEGRGSCHRHLYCRARGHSARLLRGGPHRRRHALAEFLACDAAPEPSATATVITLSFIARPRTFDSSGR